MNPIIICENSGSILNEKAKAPRKGVLRELSGTFSVSDEKSKDDNRNSRLYSKDLLTKKIVESAYTKEMMSRNCLLGEADHPADRLEIRMKEVSHRISQMSFADGEVRGVVEILDTPVGRVVDTLCEAGAQISISSRAAGNTKEEGGKLRVLEDGYTFYTYDLVLNPGFKSAVLSESNVPANENHLSPDEVNNLMVGLIEKADVSQLQVFETLLRDMDPTTFSSSITKIRERREGRDNSSKSTLTLLESVHRDLNSEREKVEGLQNEVTLLREQVELNNAETVILSTDEKEAARQLRVLEGANICSKNEKKVLETKLESTSARIKNLTNEKLRLEGRLVVLESEKRVLKEQVDVFGSIDFEQYVSADHVDELEDRYLEALNALTGLGVEVLKVIVENGDLKTLKEKVSANSPKVEIKIPVRTAPIQESQPAPRVEVIPVPSNTLVEQRRKIELPTDDSELLSEDFTSVDLRRLRKVVSKTGAQ